MISTTFDLPGYRVEACLGEVMGLTVRSRNAFSVFGSGLRSLFGGELKGQTKALYDSRRQVMDRLVGEAERRGANAVVGMRFDTSEIGNGWTEICAYGTAMRVTPVTPL
ncbi:MAG: hypothetical protein JWM02_1381 [Frankiales bacterium]|nr:hypothetical protein [Frankiales bacterium]